MSCAACSTRVEKAVSAVGGVSECAVNLLTNSMTVEGTASDDEIIRAVEKAGYGAEVKGEAAQKTKVQDNEAEESRELSGLRTRLLSSLVFLAVLMYMSMGHMMWGWPLPSAIAENHVAMGIAQLLLTGAVMVINQRFFVSGIKAAFHKAPNMDTLVAMGAGAAFIYSTYALFAMTDAQLNGDSAQVMHYMHEFYFESAAMILTLITVGKMLEAYSKGKTTNALKSLMKLAPQTATVIRDGKETAIPVEELKKGDVFVVRSGESIPADGVVVEGSGTVNEAALTGESMPVDKTEGDTVSAATINTLGFIRCEATGVGEDTALSKIIKMVSDASASKAPVAKAADKVSGVFVPTVIAIAAVTAAVWLFAGQSVGFALARGISVLVISCPCALGLATPVAIMVGSGAGARHGILFKSAAALERTGKTKIAALDKTGTITMGEPKVTDIIPSDGVSETELLKLAAALESKSEHPLASAVMQKADELGITADEVTGFSVHVGNGLSAQRNGDLLEGGSRKFIGGKTEISSSVAKQCDILASEGKTPLLFCINSKLAGIIAAADVIKPDSAQAVSELKSLGIRTVMLTGDNKRTAEAIGRQTGVDEVISDVLPDGKEEVIRRLGEQGSCAMVGDGINDAPALTRADTGIAIGAGADVAIDAADVVLMKSSLRDAAAAIRLSRATLRNIHENLFWAFIYNVIGIPLAAGVWIPVFGLTLNPMFGAAAMSLSSFCVVTNALRLNLFNIYGKNNKQRKEEKKMEKTMKIEGMMCGHCESRVKSTLEGLPGVAEAKVSHENGTAQITLSAEVSDDKLRAAVEEQGYKVISVG